MCVCDEEQPQRSRRERRKAFHGERDGQRIQEVTGKSAEDWTGKNLKSVGQRIIWNPFSYRFYLPLLCFRAETDPSRALEYLNHVATSPAATQKEFIFYF